MNRAIDELSVDKKSVNEPAFDEPLVDEKSVDKKSVDEPPSYRINLRHRHNLINRRGKKKALSRWSKKLQWGCFENSNPESEDNVQSLQDSRFSSIEYQCFLMENLKFSEHKLFDRKRKFQIGNVSCFKNICK
jgi:hypothetical protein